MADHDLGRRGISWRRTLAGCLLVGGMVLLWILAVPPSGGPDEPSHLVRGAGLVRGHAGGIGGGGDGLLEVPPWTGWPDPACYAQSEFAPASCATSAERPSGDDTPLLSRAVDYPVWGHVLPGLGTFAPAAVQSTVARVLDALVPVVLVTFSLLAAARRGWTVAGATLLAVTPLAWFVFAVVNPSGVVVAGGVAMWTGIVTAHRSPDALHRWLVAGGWAALALPRRDGFVWAGVIAALTLLWSGLGLRAAWRLLGRGPQILIGVSTIATLLYAVTSDARSTTGLLAVPLLPVVAVGARAVWRRASAQGVVVQVVAAAAGVAVATAAVYAAMSVRDGGIDREVLRIIFNRTGERLEQAVGLLGWLDTPIPASTSLLWFVALGVVAAVAILADDHRGLLLGTATVAVALVGSWTVEMAEGDPTGTYYQGRYYLPLLVGVPIAFAAVRGRPPGSERLGRYIGVVALVVVNVALAAAMRRWGVGNAGPWVPWSWNTYDTAVPPLLLLALHALASGGLWWWVDAAVRAGAMPPAPSSRPTAAVS